MNLCTARKYIEVKIKSKRGLKVLKNEGSHKKSIYIRIHWKLRKYSKQLGS